MKLRNVNGFGLVFFTFFLIGFIGAISLVIDVAHMFSSKQELQNLADNTSLAAVAEFLSQDTPSMSAIENVVQNVIDHTSLRNVVDNLEIRVGKFDVNEDTRFTPLDITDPLANAAKVTVSSNTIRMFFAKVLGIETAQAIASATASAVSRNIVLAIDYSGSTDDASYEQGEEYYRTDAWQRRRMPEPMTSIIDAASAFVDLGEGYLTVNDSVGLVGFTGYLYNDGIWKTTSSREVRIMSGSRGAEQGFGVEPEMLRAGNVRKCLQNARDYYSWYVNHRGIYQGTEARSARMPSGWWNRSFYGLDYNNDAELDRSDFERLRNDGYSLFTDAHFDYLDVQEPQGILTHSEWVNIFAPRVLLNWNNGSPSARSGDPVLFPACSDWNTYYRYSDNGPQAEYDPSFHEVINTKSNIGGVIQFAKDRVFSQIPTEQSANAARILIIISDWQTNVDRYGNLGATLDACRYYVRRQSEECAERKIVIHGIGIGNFRWSHPLERHARRCLNEATNITGGLQWRVDSDDAGDLSEQLRDVFDQISKIVPYVIVE